MGPAYPGPIIAEGMFVAFSGKGAIRVRKARKGLKPTVEAVEKRWLPSGMVPTLTTQVYRNVVMAVDRAVRDLARSHDVARASEALNAIASKIPDGKEQLAPVWNADLAGYDPRVRGSAVKIRQRLLNDLRADVAAGVAQDEFDLVGPGAHALLGSKPQASLDSVTIVNKTGYDITVTVFLNSTPQRITNPIANNQQKLFDFNSSTNNFMTLNVARVNNQQPPPPRNGINLNRPIGGYNGKPFTISVVQGFFSVNIN